MRGDINTQQMLNMLPMGIYSPQTGVAAAVGRRQQSGEAVLLKSPMTSRQKRKYDMIKGGLIVFGCLAICLSMIYTFMIYYDMYSTLRFSIGSAVNMLLIIFVYAIIGIMSILILKLAKRRKVRSFGVMCIGVIAACLILEVAFVQIMWRYFTYSNPHEDAVARYEATFEFMKRHLPNYRNIMKLVFATDADPNVMMQRIGHLLKTTAAENSTIAAITTMAPK